MRGRDRFVLGITAVPFVVGTFLFGRGAPAEEVTRFEDPEILESSGLAVIDGLLVTTNDSGDSGRVFSVDPASGRTVGVTTWSADPVDVEALAPAGDGQVWVGDIGDNTAARTSVTVARVPVGEGDRDVDVPSYELLYPEGPRDAESLLADPTSGRLYVVSKGVLGGAVYAAPKRLKEHRPNRLEKVGPVLGIATDAAFFPDGRHIIVRSYGEAAVYTWPALEVVGRFPLPDQEQGEGIAVGPDGSVYVSSEGVRAPVLRIMLPAEVRRAMRPAPTAAATPTSSAAPSASPDASSKSREDDETVWETQVDRSTLGWAVGGVVGLGLLVVLVRSLRSR